MLAIKELTVLEAEPYGVQLLRQGVAGGVRVPAIAFAIGAPLYRPVPRSDPASRSQDKIKEEEFVLLYDATERTADGLVVEDCVAIYKRQ
jgi:hypothetical protein